ncbi:hypothetical protein B0J14DRAFT_663157 [Halenospora varia]|nr:hypothetical protein B0J14DRAFT_663157 [Halenospora varia]
MSKFAGVPTRLSFNKIISQQMSSNSYDILPRVEDTDEDEPIMEKPSFLGSRNSYNGRFMRKVWEDCLDTLRSLIISGSLVAVVMIITIITSFMTHTPGAYVKMLLLSQKNC